MRTPARVLACAALASIAASALAPAARADEPAPESAPASGSASASTIAVVATSGDRFALRVQAELEALGFRTVLVEPETDSASRVSLESAARSVGAIAAVRAVPSERGVEVWIADRVTGKTLVREIAHEGDKSGTGADAGTGPDARVSPEPEDAGDLDSALALSTVELLRASLIEVVLPEAPRGEVPAPPEIRQRLALPAQGPPRPPPTFRASLAPGLLWSPGGFDPAASLDVGLSWMPTRYLGVAGFAAIPLSRPSVQGSEGGADLSVLLAGLGLRLCFTAPERRWSPSVDLGVMIASVESHGLAHAGFRAKDVAAATAAPFARAGLAFAVTPLLRVRADVLLGVIVQGVSIQLARREAATFGQPILLPSVGVDFGWF